MAYVIEAVQQDLSALRELLPIESTLAGGKRVKLVEAQPEHHEAMRAMLNGAIAEGASYPQQSPLNAEQFSAYYTAFQTFCVIDPTDQHVMGSFYIKPNFPGACSHICNGGFLTHVDDRQQGVGKFMAKCYLHLARALGYRASMFNLVFVTNTASLKLWRSLGFQELGRVPEAGYYPQRGGYVDAIQFYFDLQRTPLPPLPS